tara:strand:- start:9456 stop:11153 length:1698 start_codon:yes stop_codon:yes gene_type:complete
MSLEALKILFEKKSDISIARTKKTLDKWTVRIAEYNTLYPEVLKTAEELGIKETFQKLFPEGGGSPGYGSQLTELSNLYAYGEDILPIKALNKVADSPQKIEKLTKTIEGKEKIKADGADPYIDKIHSELNKIVKWDDIIKFGDKFLENPDDDSPIEQWSHNFSKEVEGPSGILSSPELYLAIKERGNTLTSVDDEKQKVEEPDVEEAMSEETESGEESTAINDTKVVDSPIKNTGELGEATEVSGEPVSSLNIESSNTLSVPEVEDAAVEEVESSDLNTPKEAEVPVEISNIEKNETVVNNAINNVESNKKIDAEDAPALDSGINEDKKKKKKRGFGKFLSKIGGGISNIYQSSNLSDVVGSISKDFKSSIISPLNSITNRDSKNIKNEESNSSSSSNVVNDSTSNFSGSNTDNSKSTGETVVNNAISNITGDVSNKSLQEVKEGLDKESIIDKTSSLKSVSKSSIIQPPPITKEDITNVGKDISSSVSSGADIKSNLNVPDAQSPSKKETRIDNVGNTQAEGQPMSKGKKGNTNINNDFSQLEKRLKNIELLLSGPLEVKIKN